MIKKYWWVAAPLGVALAAAAFVGTRDDAGVRATSRPTVRISAGLTRVRGFKPLGEALVAEYEKVMPDVRFVVLESPGSVRNLQNLQSGEADLGFVQADLAYMGYNGQLPDTPERLSNIRGIAVMHASNVHLLARSGLPIRSIADLEGRRVGVGPSDSGTAVTSELLLKAFNLQPGKVAGFAVPSPQAIDRLIAGELDATFVVSADPAEEVRRATQAGARLVDIGGAEVDRFRAQYPFLRPGIIAGGTYDHHPEPIRTLAIDVLLVARTGLDEGLVHRLTRTFFEVLPRVAHQVEFIRSMDPSRAPATPVPLHPGAALYYRERELSR